MPRVKTITAAALAELENEGHEIQHPEKAPTRIEGFEALAAALEALAESQNASARLQSEVIMALQKVVNRPVVISGGTKSHDGPQMEAILARIETAVAAKENKDNPVYTFDFKRDPNGFTMQIVATPSPTPTRPGPY